MDSVSYLYHITRISFLPVFCMHTAVEDCVWKSSRNTVCTASIPGAGVPCRKYKPDSCHPNNQAPFRDRVPGLLADTGDS